ncbi:hypothetical protein J4573_13060 [Actinomadura barringtoniae]|uniref:LysR substrate-binding domain-containing protein n=1 Tax=Actinomadura barringtoniae TaxID=1427535 RepID=A0A939T1Q3_9ACTN|nr:LysR substrate-binding domain-containing protein [Actinomadura barringtoniae]MBO2448026.1 hypothetical protein [Actinomadura barringtoniae]
MTRRATAVAEVRRMAQGLSVGYFGSFIDVLDELVRVYKGRDSGREVRVREIHWADMLGPLRRGEVDVQLTSSPLDQPDLVTGPVVAEYPRVLAISSAHPLVAAAGTSPVTVEDLAGVTMVRPHESVPPELAAAFMPPPATPSGRPIPRGPIARSHHEMLNFVARGDGAYLTCTATTLHYAYPGVAFLPFAGLPPARAVLYWRRGTETDRIRDLIDAAGASR